MLGFSIQKLLVLAGIIGAVWYGFKLVGRLDQARKSDPARRGGQKPTARSWWPKRDAATKDERGEAQDMVQCPRCKAYVPAGSDHDCEPGDGPSA